MRVLLVLAALAVAGTARAADETVDSTSRPALYVSFTMDCERIAEHCFPGGPETWDLSERAIRGFSTRLLDAGIRPTLFIVPETGQQHPELFKSLARRGAELGMHLHPQCFLDHRYDKYFGEYDAAMQKDLLRQGLEMLTEALEERPRAFRPGNFSASDATYQVLFDVGFRQGSVSDPGRLVPEYHADWKDATPDAHWANAANRAVPGRLGFFEAPLTTDPTKRRPNGFPHELRIESGTFDEWHRPIIERALERMETEQVPFRVLSIFTHNYFDYSDPDAPRTKVVDGYTAYLSKLKERYDVFPGTLSEIRERYVAQVGEPGN